MCVIIHQPTGQHLSKDLARELWKENPDGGGFAFLDDDKNLVVEKRMNFPAFWHAFETARSQNPHRDYLLHMRIATHGSISLENVHPFRVDEHTVMAHNGILHEVTDELEASVGDDRTDTEYFVEHVISKMPTGWLDDFHLSKMLDEYIGWSRLMFITSDPALSKSVYRLGDWDAHDGVYLSNLHHLEEPTLTYENSGWQMVNGGETSEQWDDWLEYKEMLVEYEESDKGLTGWELDMALEALMGERKAMSIDHGIIIVDEFLPKLQCSGCLDEIDLDTAECGCWDKACMKCMSYIAHCKVRTNCGVSDMRDIDNLTKKERDIIVGPTFTELLPVPAEGAGNTAEQLEAPF